MWKGCLGERLVQLLSSLKIGCTLSSCWSVITMCAFARPEEEGHGRTRCLGFPHTMAVVGAGIGGTSPLSG